MRSPEPPHLKPAAGDGPPWNRFALHELFSRDAMDKPERDLARTALKRLALADRPWFVGSGRWVYELISAHR